MPSGKLLLLPNLLDEELPYEPFLPASVAAAVRSLDGLIAESEKSARRYLRRFVSHEKMAAMPLCALNEHTPEKELDELIAPIAAGQRWGLISDAGLPCVADPGAALVLRAHARRLEVETFVGPCSLLLALQLSGLSGQNFAFHGYLPRELPALQQALVFLEKRSHTEKAAQIWIEAPYRSAKLKALAIELLQPATLFCIAVELTSPRQRVRTQTIAAWKKESFALEKEPAVFLLQKF